MRACRGMGAMKASKMPGKKTIKRKDNPDDVSMYAKGGKAKLDISKAKQRLHWAPRWSLEQALEHIIHWHRTWLDGQDMHALCLQQIHQYQNQA